MTGCGGADRSVVLRRDRRNSRNRLSWSSAVGTRYRGSRSIQLQSWASGEASSRAVFFFWWFSHVEGVVGHSLSLFEFSEWLTVLRP